MSDPLQLQLVIDALRSVWPQEDTTLLTHIADKLLREQTATLGTSTASLTFGQDNNFSHATITVGNIAGGNIINLTINLPQSIDSKVIMKSKGHSISSQIEKMIAEYRDNITSRFEDFVPLGTDQPIKLDTIYQDLAIYKQFSSPYYKSRHDLLREMDIEGRSDLHHRISIQLERRMEYLVGEFEEMFIDSGKIKSVTKISRAKVMERLLHQEKLIDELSELDSAEELDDLLVRRLGIDIFRDLLIDIGYQDGVMSRLLTEHIHQLDGSFIKSIQIRFPLQKDLENNFVDINTYIKECSSDARYTIERELLMIVLKKFKSNNKEQINDRDSIIKLINTWRDKIIREIQIYESQKERVDFDYALAEWKRFVILGHPGSGKSTLLRHKLLTLSRDKNKYLPICVSLRDFNNETYNLTLWDLVIKELNDDVDPLIFRDELSDLFRNGGIILLLDGLDEVDEVKKVYVLDEIVRFLSLYKLTPCAITCRILGYVNPLPYKSLELAELNNSQIKSFINEWFKKDPDYGDKVLVDVYSSNRIWRMIRNPFILTMYCIARKSSSTIQFSRSVLYQKSTNILLSSFDKSKGLKRNNYSTRKKERVLGIVAKYMHHNAREIFVIDDVSDLLLPDVMNRSSDLDDIIQEISNNSGIVRQLSEIDFGFAHLSVQEYYVALNFIHDNHIPYEYIEYQRYWEVIRLFCGLSELNVAKDLICSVFEDIHLRKWQFIAFLASCIIEMPLPPENLIRIIGKEIVIRYQDRTIDTDARAILTEDFMDIIQKDAAEVLNNTLIDLIGRGYEDLELAVSSIITSDSKMKIDILKKSIALSNYYYSYQIAWILSRYNTAYTTKLLILGLEGESASKVLELLGPLSRKFPVDMNDLIYDILTSELNCHMTSPNEGFYLRINKNIDSKYYSRIKLHLHNYILNVKSYTQREKVYNRFTMIYEEPNESLMRYIEEFINIPESRKDDFRCEIMNMIGAAVVDQRPFTFMESRLRPYIEHIVQMTRSGSDLSDDDKYIELSVLLKYNNNNINDEIFNTLWRKPKTEMRSKGLSVGDRILFPFSERGEIFKLIFQFCENYFNASMLDIIYQDINESVRKDIMNSLNIGLNRYIIFSMPGLISIQSYINRLKYEIFHPEMSRVIGILPENFDISSLHNDFCVNLFNQTKSWWNKNDDRRKFLAYIEEYKKSFDYIKEDIIQNKHLIEKFIKIPNIYISDEVRKIITIIRLRRNIDIDIHNPLWNKIFLVHNRPGSS